METIKASKLTIGNSIKQFNYDFYEDKKWKTEDFDIVEVDLIILESISKEDDFSELFEGIPITQEVLLEYGAERISEGRFDFEFYLYGYFDLTEEGLIITFQSHKMSEPIKYLHNLQNLIYELTKKELKKI